MIGSQFEIILRQAVEATPGAIGAALAAGDGELVDSWTSWVPTEFAILNAHYGIVVNHIRSALHTFHFGDVEFLYLSHDKLDLAIQIVSNDYYAILVVEAPVDLPKVAKTMQVAVDSLHREMM